MPSGDVQEGGEAGAGKGVRQSGEELVRADEELKVAAILLDHEKRWNHGETRLRSCDDCEFELERRGTYMHIDTDECPPCDNHGPFERVDERDGRVPKASRHQMSAEGGAKITKQRVVSKSYLRAYWPD